MMKNALLIAALVCFTIAPAYAWGTAGHRLIGETAMQTLPVTVPPFLRTDAAIKEVTALGPELDRLKGSGNPHDADDDPGHYLDALDDLSIAGVAHLEALPKDRQAYATALAAAHTNEYTQGYLPYSIIDGWEQIRKDFTYWRADNYLTEHAATPEDRAWFASDKALREDLTLRDIGVWGHVVGDACQPLHVTVHFNGWGKYPNPKRYSTSSLVHSNFEGAYVRDHATQDAVRALVSGTPIADTTTPAVISQIEGYLIGSAHAVVPLYELDLQNAFSTAGSPAGTTFVQHQLARGAQEMRDLIVAAWDSSLTQGVSYPFIPLSDILSGKVLPAPKSFGSD
ncbi:MAG: S1/P1 Nuclease [Candidatus Baltobacteraceae bacterium]